MIHSRTDKNESFEEYIIHAKPAKIYLIHVKPAIDSFSVSFVVELFG